MQFSQVKKFYENFIPMSEEEWNLLEPKFRVLTLNKGEKLQSEGEVCNDVTFVNKGLLKCYHFIDGKEYIEAFFSQNEYCSDYCSFLLRQPGKLFIEALEESELILLDYDTVQVLYDKVKKLSKVWTIDGRVFIYADFITKQCSPF